MTGMVKNQKLINFKQKIFMLRKLKFYLLTAMFCIALGMNAQVTTSALSGIVTDENEQAMIGATVTALHNPSGTKYNAVTNLDGRYTIQGMRPGGPYTVTVSYVGYETAECTNINLQLGNTYKLDCPMRFGSQNLTEVVVTGQGKRQEAGASHNFNMSAIEGAATVDRNIYDIVKNMPMANKNKLGGMSFAGSNNKYNSFQVDGAVQNDVFGLAASGTNGGQASANPISMDAIQEIQVVVAPYDVRQGGFTGGGINAITKQGTNEVKVNFWTYYTNENMYGRYNAAQGNIKNKLGKQHYTTIGGNIGGAIVKDKLFYFLNLENHSESYPSSWYPGIKDYISEADANAMLDKQAMFNNSVRRDAFDPKDVERKAFDLLGRLDWNINDNHKFGFRYHFVNASDDKYSAGTSSYYFNNSSYKFNNKTNSFVAELNSNFGSDFYNELRASYTRVRDSRDVPYQGPLFMIRNVGPKNTTVYLGTEYSSGANRLDQDICSLEDNFSWYKGNHTFTFGTHNELYQSTNLFIQGNNGEWVYNSLDDFLNDRPTQFVFKCTDPNIVGKNLLWTPTLKAGQFGFYAQDKWDINKNLQLTYGLRFDIPVFFNEPTTNTEFNAYADAKGFGVKTGEMPGAKLLVSPRLGFRWFTNDSHNTLFRGGIGMFTGRVPFVWMSNAYSNNGVEITGTTINNVADIPAVTNDPWTLTEYLNKGKKPSPDIVVVDKKFKFPQVLRANLAWEQDLGDDWKFTLEGLWSKTLNNAYFDNLALTNNGDVYAVADVPASTTPYYSVDKSYYTIINTKNTNKGYSGSISATIEKSFNFGLDLLASYTYAQSKSINDCTSSVAYSNWKYNYAWDSNNPKLTYSSFDQPHRVLLTANYNSPKYAGGYLQTIVGLTYNGYNGQRYSLTYSDNTDFNGDGYRGNSLMYIPTDNELSSMMFKEFTYTDNNGNRVTVSPEQQRDWFGNFIATDNYAKNHRGQYAERNGNIGGWENQIDLHFAENIFVLEERGSKIQLTFDVLNFANMLNKKWGAVWSQTYNVSPLKCMGVSDVNGAKVAQFQWNGNTEETGNTKPDKSNVASRWHAQVGVKLTF